MSQQFDTVDVLRLEVEDDPTGLVNLIQNPSGNLGGWGWITPVATSYMSGGATAGGLTYHSPSPAAASYFYSENMPIAAGQYAAASWNIVSVSGYYRVKIEWLNSSLASLGFATQTGYLNATGATVYGPYLAPASTAYMRLRFDHYSSTGGANPTAGSLLKVKEVTVAKAATSGALGSSRTNLIPNPSFETNTTGWTGQSTTVARSTAQFYSGAASLSMTATAVTTTLALTPGGTSGIPVTGSTTYAIQFRSRAATTPRNVEFYVYWYDSAGALIGMPTTGGYTTNSTSGWTLHSGTKTSPSNAAYARVAAAVYNAAIGEVHYIDAVMMEQASSVGTYFDGSTAAGGGWSYAWSGTAHASASTATSSNLAYIEPVPYVNVLGPTHDIKVVREALNVGTLSATILDATLDPSTDDLIRPGRRVRLTAYWTNGDVWMPVFTGKATEASVTYELKDPAVPDSKRARISLTAVDATADLANQQRSEGVENIADLPYVLEGCGVPWNVNGSGNQVPSATVVAVNDNASALDQIAITRDTNLGYAWVDQYGVAQVWDSASMGSSWTSYIEAWVNDYTDLDIDYDTDRCINEVNVKFLRYNPSTGQTEEVPYGPYRDETSIAEWGVRSATFTIQGSAEETAGIPAYAASILAANATPQVRVNTMTVPITENWHLSYFVAMNGYDLLYSDAYIEKPHDASIAPGAGPNFDTLGITRIEYSITPEKWLVKYGFEAQGSVASPQFVPSPNTGAGGQTIGQLLRPVGEITMFGGSTPPAGWLLCAGGTFSSNTYPELAALLGDTFGTHVGTVYYLPNFTDRFPIGAGTKALGTSGGAASHTLTAAQMAHTHTHAHTHSIAGQAGGTAAPRGTGTANVAAFGTFDGHAHGGDTGAASTSATSGVVLGAPTAVDHMNPWRAVNFIIRAV